MTTEAIRRAAGSRLEGWRKSLHRVRALLMMQMGDKLRRREGKERRRFIFRFFLIVLAAVGITAAVSALCILLHSRFFIILDRGMLAAILFVAQAVAVLANLGAVQRAFFTDKENSLLLTFPCSFGEIVASRLLLFLLNEVKKNCFFLLPFLLGFAVATGAGVGFYLVIPLALLLLSALPVFVDCVLAILVLYAKRILYARPIFCAIGTAALLLLGFLAVTRVLVLLPDPLRFVQEYVKYLAAIAAFAETLAGYSLYCAPLADLLLGTASFGDVLLLLAYTVGIPLVSLLVLVPFYFKAVSSTTERSSASKREGGRHLHLGKGSRRKAFSLYRTFLRKEILTTLRNPHKLGATVTAFLALPMASYVMNFLLDAINTNPLGDYMVIAFNLIISVSLLATFNTDCAYALSAEGLEFAELKAAPSHTAAIVWGKITVTLFSDLFAIAATAIMLYYTAEISPLDLLLFTVTLFLLAVILVLWSFQLDVRRPQFAEYAAKGASGVVDNPNVGLATLIGFGLAFVSGALTLLLLYDDYVTGWLRILGIVLGVCLARIYLFISNLQAHFEDLEL